MSLTTAERIGVSASKSILKLPDFHQVVPRLPHQKKLDAPFPFDRFSVSSEGEKINPVEVSVAIDSNLDWC